MPARLTLSRKTDNDARPAIGGFRRQLFHGFQACFQESRLQHQIFRRIARYEQLGQKQKIGALRRRISPCLARLGEIARHVANGGIELPDGNPEMVLYIVSVAHGFSIPRPCPLRNAAIAWRRPLRFVRARSR